MIKNKIKRVSDQYWFKAVDIHEEWGGDIIKIEKCLKKYIGVDGRRRACPSVQKQLDELDLDYILGTRRVWGVDYLYWHDTEVGSV